jgi:Flp pilus assembly protein protease CpaA
MSFIFWFFLAGFLIAALQDLKRREVDNWLNLFLFFSGFLYVLFKTFFYGEISFLINFAFLVFLMLGLIYLFYFARVFSGGDCKLLFAATPLFVSIDFINSLQNVLFFSMAILFIGAIYGAFWILGLFFKDFGKNKKDFVRGFKKSLIYFISFSVFLILGFFDRSFFALFFIVIFLVFIFLISKAVEKNSLIREVYSKDLREGDWLEKNLSFKGKKIKSTFDGLSLEDIAFLKNYKKRIRIKDGVPFAPVFVFAWIVFYFKGVVMEWIFSFL